MTASYLKSPHILTLFDLSIDKKCIYLIMEYADGGTLKRLLDREGKLPIEQAVNIIIEACRGVADAHAQNTVHRDLKPGNIFFVGGQVKIGDFGLAKILTDSQIGGTAGTGTLEYCAPEQFTTNYDWRVDLWTLSVILYELLVGKTPYRGEETPYLIAQITQSTPVQIPDSVPAPLRPIWENGLNKDRTQRYQSADELRQALESVVASKSELLKQATDAFDAKRYDDAGEF